MCNDMERESFKGPPYKLLLKMSQNGCHKNLAGPVGGNIKSRKNTIVNKIINTCRIAVFLFDMNVAICSLYEHILIIIV